MCKQVMYSGLPVKMNVHMEDSWHYLVTKGTKKMIDERRMHEDVSYVSM